jgi:hypothetical protein
MIKRADFTILRITIEDRKEGLKDQNSLDTIIDQMMISRVYFV